MPEHVINVPRPLSNGATAIQLSGDLKEMAETMTDTERNALIIQTFRMQQEILNNTREIAKAFAMMENLAPMLLGGLGK